MKKVIVVGAISRYTIKSFLKACSELDLAPVFILCKNHVPSVEELSLDNILLVDSLDIDLIDVIENKIRSIDSEIFSIVPGGELSVFITEELCKIFGLPHNSGNISRFRDKYLMRKTLENNDHVNQPAVYARISSENEIEQLELNDDLFPLIIKPIDGAASFFVKKVMGKSDIRHAFKPIYNHSYSEATGVKFLKSALLEEYVQGIEYSAEVIVSGQNIIDYSVTRKVLSDEPYFDEIGHISLPKSEELNGVDKFISAVIEGMRVDCGVLHIEFRINEKTEEIYLIEVALRIAGDLISNIAQKQHGFSLEKSLIAIKSRNPQSLVIEPLSNKKMGYVGVKFLFGEDSGIVGENITVIEQDIAQKYKNREGNGPKNVLNRTGYIIFLCPNMQAALNFIRS